MIRNLLRDNYLLVSIPDYTQLTLCPLIPIMSNRHNTTRGWWRAYFHDHPIVSTNPTAHIYGSVSAGRTKTYCIQCWNAFKNDLMNSDRVQVENGTIDAVRNDDALNNICMHPIVLGYINFILIVISPHLC